MNEGDVYSIKLRDRRYGTVRVLRSGPFGFSAAATQDGHLLALTTYIGKHKPGLSAHACSGRFVGSG